MKPSWSVRRNLNLILMAVKPGHKQTQTKRKFSQNTPYLLSTTVSSSHVTAGYPVGHLTKFAALPYLCALLTFRRCPTDAGQNIKVSQNLFERTV